MKSVNSFNSLICLYCKTCRVTLTNNSQIKPSNIKNWISYQGLLSQQCWHEFEVMQQRQGWKLTEFILFLKIRTTISLLWLLRHRLKGYRLMQIISYPVYWLNSIFTFYLMYCLHDDSCYHNIQDNSLKIQSCQRWYQYNEDYFSVFSFDF